MENKSGIKRIAVLTSGGDAPGMNAAIRAIVRSGIDAGLEVYGIDDGYKGLIEGRFHLMDRMAVSETINRGGTILGSARLKEFKNLEVQQKGVEKFRELGIDALIAIGGDGTYQGALKLTRLGVNCIGVPATIDNDIASTEYSIGFHTAVNTAVDAIDKIRDTSNSHRRCSVVEVMGRYCGDLAYAAALATGADYVITADIGFNMEQIIKVVKKCQKQNRRHILIVVTEHITDTSDLARQVEIHTGYESRATVLGHMQRGGTPVWYDRNLASRLGTKAVECLLNGEGGKCVGIFNNEIKVFPIEEALKMKKNIFEGYPELTEKLS
jgi:6-phosphofructokinase 1